MNEPAAQNLPVLLPTHSIDTFSMPAEQSREVWQQIVEGTFQLEGRPEPERGHRVRTQVWFLEELLFASFTAESNVVHRTPALVSQNPTPVVKVRMYRSGYSLFVQGDDRVAIGTGAIHIIDHDRPHRQISTDHEQITISVPYHAIGYDPSLHPACFSIGLDTPRGRLLQAGVQTLFGEIRQVTPAEAPALSTAFAGLLRGTLVGNLDSHDDETVRNGRTAAMKRYIDQNLAVPGLDINALLRDFGASRATIYRDFADVGGLQHFILERRLQRAYRLLAEAAPVRGSIQEVAARCGFATLAHFSRCFREYHRTTPTEIVGQWNSTIRGLAQVEPIALPEKPGNSPDIAALHWAYTRFK